VKGMVVSGSVLCGKEHLPLCEDHCGDKGSLAGELFCPWELLSGCVGFATE
jgi:hypothetical protein